MITKFTVLLAAATTCTVAGPLTARAATLSCSGLSGSYGLEVAGFTTSEGKFLNGVVTFNNACSLTGAVTIGENNSVQSFVGISGTYSSSPTDNTVSISLKIPGETAFETYQVAVSSMFAEADGIETDTSAVATISLKAQNFAGAYNNTSLYGTFAVSCIGAAASSSDLNYVTFGPPTATSGGYGVLSGVDYFHNGGTTGVDPYVGLYGVGANGAFGGEVSVGSTAITASTTYNFGFSGVIDNNLNEIQYNYSTAAAAGVPAYNNVACTGKRISAAAPN